MALPSWDPRKGPQRLCGNRRGYFQESGSEREIAAILYSTCLSSLSIPTGPSEGPNQLPANGSKNGRVYGRHALAFLSQSAQRASPTELVPLRPT